VPEHLSSLLVFSRVRVAHCSIFSFICMFCRSLFVLLTIVLSVLRFTDSCILGRVLQIIQVDTTLSEDEIFMESSKKKNPVIRQHPL
jgi:hypothetical protein